MRYRFVVIGTMDVDPGLREDRDRSGHVAQFYTDGTVFDPVIGIRREDRRGKEIVRTGSGMQRLGFGHIEYEECYFEPVEGEG